MTKDVTGGSNFVTIPMLPLSDLNAMAAPPQQNGSRRRSWHGLRRPDSLRMADTLRRSRILVIDDDPSVREVVSYLLETFGYDCETAANGRRGLARFDEGGWDLVITDLVMPELNGWDVVEGVRRHAPSIPIILMTAVSDPTLMRRASEARLPVVTKPFRVETLRTAVIDGLHPGSS